MRRNEHKNFARLNRVADVLVLVVLPILDLTSEGKNKAQWLYYKSNSLE